MPTTTDVGVCEGSAEAGVRGGCSQWRLAQRREKRKTLTLVACGWTYARSIEQPATSTGDNYPHPLRRQCESMQGQRMASKKNNQLLSRNSLNLQ
jgi:hypothetical protein